VAGVPVGDYALGYEDLSPELQAYDRALLGGTPDQVPELMRTRNPINFADRVSAPVIFLIGENDTRCPFRQAMAYDRFKALADRKKHVYDEDIEALVDEEIASAHDRMHVLSLTVIAGTMGPQSATMTLDIEGEHRTIQATGNGPVDAIFNSIKALVPHEAELELYQVSAVTEGTDAQAEVSVRLQAAGKTYTGRAADTDTLVASAKAYLAALNKLMARRDRIHAQAAQSA
jgi:hypothetical protein